jgi:polyisoprenoid-binding protein YceI
MSAHFHALFAAALLGLVLSLGSAGAAPYVFDSKRGEVLFAYTLPFSSGKGRFSGVTGTAELNDAAPETGNVDVVIDARTLRASDSLSQAELRGSSFFAAPKYPTMHFRSRSIRGKSTRSYEITGDMTVKGITRRIVLHAELEPPNGGVRQMRATTRIRRGDFGMTAYGFLVGETVDIEIRAPLMPAR